jgi:hypothetical protein
MFALGQLTRKRSVCMLQFSHGPALPVTASLNEGSGIMFLPEPTRPWAPLGVRLGTTTRTKSALSAREGLWRETWCP